QHYLELQRQWLEDIKPTLEHCLTNPIEVHNLRNKIQPFVAHIDEMVLSAGGRHYLAKDATTGSQSIRSGYPRLDEWQHIRHRVDPDQRWQSDLSRRLNLCATPKDSE
ncbi:MAG: D-arabinono-1,4-lactone oxidase, partial [Ilumatobacteraceae bacterium]